MFSRKFSSPRLTPIWNFQLNLTEINGLLPIVGKSADTFKSITAVLMSSSHSQWQVYLPSSSFVTLKIKRTYSFLHLVCVSLSSELYFLAFSKYAVLFPLSHSTSWGQLPSKPDRHVRLILEKALARILSEDTIGPCAEGPVTKEDQFYKWVVISSRLRQRFSRTF